MESEPRPAEPEVKGVPSETPDLAQIEPARILANEARERLQAKGFSDTQIHHWAETYVAEAGGTADVEQFIDWIAEQEQ